MKTKNSLRVLLLLCKRFICAFLRWIYHTQKNPILYHHPFIPEQVMISMTPMGVIENGLHRFGSTGDYIRFNLTKWDTHPFAKYLSSNFYVYGCFHRSVHGVYLLDTKMEFISFIFYRLVFRIALIISPPVVLIYLLVNLIPILTKV